jgi:hypothetical protein
MAGAAVAVASTHTLSDGAASGDATQVRDVMAFSQACVRAFVRLVRFAFRGHRFSTSFSTLGFQNVLHNAQKVLDGKHEDPDGRVLAGAFIVRSVGG